MKILEILGQSKDQLEEKKKARVGKALARKQAALLDDLEEKKDNLSMKLANLLEIKTDTVNVETWATDYHNAKMEYVLIEEEIKLAKETQAEFFTES